MTIEVSPVNGVHFGKKAHIAQKYGGFDGLVEVSACRIHHGLQILHDLMGFGREAILHQFARNRIQGYLSRHIQQAIVNDGLVVWAYGRRSSGSLYDLHGATFIFA